MTPWDRVNKIEAAREGDDLDTSSVLARKTRGLKSGLTVEQITELRVAGYDTKGWNAVAKERS